MTSSALVLPPDEPPQSTGTGSPDKAAEPARTPLGTPARQRTRPIGIAAAVSAVFAVALALRLIALDRAYDIFVDEISYVSVARNLATGQGLTLHGGPFHLHPPGFFVVLAGMYDLLGTPGDTMSLIYSTRPVNAVFGAAVCAGVTLLLARLTSAPIAVGAGLLLAVDPFLLKFDSRVMLEAPAMAAAVLGLALLTVRARPRTAPLWGVACGLLFGISILTKDWYAFVTAVPLVILCLTADRVQRRLRWTALVTTLLCYGGYVFTMYRLGALADWRAEKAGGLARASGAEQVTGFNAAGAESLTDRILANLQVFGASYLVIAAGALVTVVLAVAHLRRGRFPKGGIGSVATAVGLGAFAFIGYAVLFGTLEEQMFYPVLVTSVVVIAIGLDLLQRLRHRRPRQDRYRRIAVAAALGLAVALAFNVSVWAGIRSDRDDTYRQLVAWAAQGLPAGSTVSATDDASQFLLQDTRLGQWGSVGDLITHDVDFVIVSTALADRGYAHAGRSFVEELDVGAPVVFTTHGRTMGELRVYDVRMLVIAHTSGALK